MWDPEATADTSAGGLFHRHKSTPYLNMRLQVGKAAFSVDSVQKKNSESSRCQQSLLIHVGMGKLRKPQHGMAPCSAQNQRLGGGAAFWQFLLLWKQEIVTLGGLHQNDASQAVVCNHTRPSLFGAGSGGGDLCAGAAGLCGFHVQRGGAPRRPALRRPGSAEMSGEPKERQPTRVGSVSVPMLDGGRRRNPGPAACIHDVCVRERKKRNFEKSARLLEAGCLSCPGRLRIRTVLRQELGSQLNTMCGGRQQ